MEYDILFDSSPEGLAKKIKQMIADGWTPQGGVAVSTQNDAEYYFYQAMVRNV